MKKCKSFEKQLAAYIHGELAERNVQALEAHLDTCEACRAELEAQRATLEILGTALEEAPAPEYLSARHTVSNRPSAYRNTLADHWYSPRLKTTLVTLAACSVFAFISLGLMIPRLGGRWEVVEESISATEQKVEIGKQVASSKPKWIVPSAQPAPAMKLKKSKQKGVEISTPMATSLTVSKAKSGPVTLLMPEIVVASGDVRANRLAGIDGMADMGSTFAYGYAGSPVEKEFNTEQYSRIVDNAFKLVMQNPLSTFSIDVDRAAYANVRRFLNSNRLPPPDAVRIEEMINYFDYDYPQPQGDDPFAVSMELAECPWNEKHQLALVGLQGLEIETKDLPPNNLVFLLDVSGSMNGPDKLPLLKSAMRLLVAQLRPEDHVSIVVYAGAAGIVLEPTTDKAKILEAIERLHAGGSTAGGAGIELAYKVAKQGFIRKGNNRVILATDGDFNVGVSSDGDLVRLIEEKRETGIFLSVLGFGTGNYKDSKMEQLADKGNGNYAYIDDILEAKKVLVTEMGGTLVTIAKDVKIQIEFNPAAVKAYRLIGYENRILAAEDFDDDKKDAGELGAGHTVTALYELILADSDEQVPTAGDLKYQTAKLVPSDDLMTVKLRYKQPDGDKSKLIVQSVNKASFRLEPTDNIRFASTVAELGLLLRDSEYKGSANYEQLLLRARKSKGPDSEGYRAEFIRLVERAQLLDSMKSE